jgi:5-methylcytosine-specific restriction endonuclease McrA
MKRNYFTGRWWRRKPRCKSWITWRTKVYERDGYKCILCGRGNCRIDPHHILPKSLFPKLKYLISNGATLCRRCHRKTFKKELQFVIIIVTKLFGSLEKWKLYKYYKGIKQCL